MTIDRTEEKENEVYIVIDHPDTHDCSIQRFTNLKEALEYYDIYKGYGSEPILTKVLEVETRLVSEVKND